MEPLQYNEIPTSLRGYLAWKNNTPAPAKEKDKKKKDKEEKADESKAKEVRQPFPIKSIADGDFGDLPMVQSAYKTDRVWTNPVDMSASRAGELVWCRARIHSSRTKGNMTWLLLRKGLPKRLRR
jgi:aspartyl-tRNA synthetase